MWPFLLPSLFPIASPFPFLILSLSLLSHSFPLPCLPLYPALAFSSPFPSHISSPPLPPLSFTFHLSFNVCPTYHLLPPASPQLLSVSFCFFILLEWTGGQIVFKDTLDSSVSHVPYVHSQSMTVSLLNGSNVEVGGLNFSFPFPVPSMVQLFPELERAEQESGSR